MKKKSLVVLNHPRECQYCEHYAARGIYQVCTYQSWISEAMPSLFPAVPRVVMPYGTCEHFGLHQKFIKTVADAPRKKLCGLHGAHVVVSPENHDGTCACIGCLGTHCQICEEYKTKARDLTDGTTTVTANCARCMERQR